MAALVPWPAATAEQTRLNALVCLRQATGCLLADIGDTDAHRLAATVSARIQRYAPGAPPDVKDEALIRGVGYMAQSIGTGAIVSETVGPLSVTFDPRMASGWFKHSTAGSLLSPWRKR